MLSPPSRFVSLFLALVVLAWSEAARATFGQPCSEGVAKHPISGDGCCEMLILPCSARPGNPDACCEQGYITTNLKNNCPGHDCSAFFGSGPFDTCVPLISGSEPEEANGVDDNCDGLGVGDEFCNGIDDDGDGLIDEDLGSCVQRFLFVPYCWQGTDPAALTAATTRWLDFFEQKSLVTGCGREISRGRKFWSDNAPLSLIGCPTATTLDDLVQATRDAGVDLRNYDVVNFVTNTPPPDGCIAGLTSGDGLVSLTSGGTVPGYPGEYVVFSHEFGHIIGLGEEYEAQAGTPNPVTTQLGCDPATCCVYPHACTWLDGHRCLGNQSSNAAGWSWKLNTENQAVLADPQGQPSGLDGPYPGFFGDGSRCIMSNASAPGWDLATDPQTGEGSHRAWCALCLRNYTLQGPKCVDVFQGAKRRLEANGHVDGSGKVLLSYLNVADGRAGAGEPSQGGATTIEVRDATGTLLSTFAPKHAHAEPVDIPPSLGIPFWLRVPVGASTTPPIKFTSYVGGVQVSQVTGGGQPAVPQAPDAVVECTSPQGAVVTLDASSSYDPDGDTLYFRWESSDVVLSGVDTPFATGAFPLGQHTVFLTVVDGTNSGATIPVTVLVRDTTGPTISNIVLSPQCLWPPNHKLVPFELGGNVSVFVSDVCDPSPSVAVVSVQSSDPLGAKGSGATPGDFAFGSDVFCLRAERSGQGARSYTVGFQASDAFGNKTSASVGVLVPASAGMNCPALPATSFVSDEDPACNLPNP